MPWAVVRWRRGKWVLDYRDQHGQRRWETTRYVKQEDCDKAVKLLRDRELEIEKGEYQAKREHKRFDDLVEVYLTGHVNVNVRETTRWDYERKIRLHLLPYFKGLKIRAITPEMVETFRAWSLENGAARATVNKCIQLLGAMFKHAIRLKWATHNPVTSIQPLKGGTEQKEDLDKDNILRPDEIQRLLAVFGPSDEKWRMMIMAAILTGLRQGELLGLKWGDLDWHSSQIYVRRCFTRGHFYEPKTKCSRRKVDMPSVLVSELRRWKLQCPKGDLDLAFPSGAGNPENHGNLLRRGFYPALRRAKLKHIRFHDLRHTYASLLIANGEHPKYIQDQMGHSSIQVTMDIYGHLMKGTNTQAAEKLAAFALGGSKMVANRS